MRLEAQHERQGIHPDMSKPTIALRDLNQPEIAEGLRQRVAKLSNADLTDELQKSLRMAIMVGYMLIDTHALGEKGDMADAIRQADAQLRFGRAAVDEYARRKAGDAT
jgi:hypothetical protein